MTKETEVSMDSSEKDIKIKYNGEVYSLSDLDPKISHYLRQVDAVRQEREQLMNKVEVLAAAESAFTQQFKKLMDAHVANTQAESSKSDGGSVGVAADSEVSGSA